MPDGIRVVVFDLDGTLTKIHSVWQFLHERLGTWDRGSVNAERFRAGEISYEDWARLDAECWRGQPVKEILRVLEDIEYTRGARETAEFLRNEGFRTAIVSAGLTVLSRKVRNDLGIDLDVANELHAEKGVLDGGVTVRVDVGNKPKIIDEMVWLLGAEMKQAAVIGDNEFDIHPHAGLRIAFNPKNPKARSAAQVVIESDDLAEILPHIRHFQS
jgi:phosphoserine phosphatase